MIKKAFFTFLITLGFLAGNTFAQSFSLATLTFNNNTITIQDTGYKNTHPCMADFDGDGDLDLILGTNKSTLVYYRNDDIDTNVGGSDSTLDGTKMVLVSRALIPPIKDANNIVLYNYVPAAGDIDGDGLVDLFLGTNNGAVFFLKNTGVVNNVPQFSLIEQVIPSNNKAAAAPFLVDMDGDGDLDLFIGYFDGEVDYYENTGDSTSYNFVLNTTDILGSYSTYQSVIPCLYDINGDGTKDMLLGRKNNTIVYYTGAISNGTISFTYQTNKWQNLNFDQFTSPNLIDLKNDGSLELLVGQYNGQIALYTDVQNTPALVTKMFASIDIGYLATPLLFDMDGDGDLDLLVAHQTEIAYLINTGSGSNLNFDLSTLTYITVSQPITSLDVWDYDNDGDLDVFFGTTSGGVGLLQNDGVVNGTVSFTEVYTGYGYNGAVESFDTMYTPNPDAAICIGDFDGDGDMDFIIANQYGTSTFYRNDDINVNVGGSDQTLDGWQAGNFVKVDAGYGSGDSYFPFTLPGYNSIKARDLDGDGDLDFLTTGADGKVYKITNTGTATAPSYVLDSTPLADIPQFDDQSTYLIKTKLDIRDFNGDGWYDLVLGGGEGGLKFYVNSSSQDTTPPTEPGNFTGQALSESKIKLTWDISTDLNGSGVKEYVIKRYNGGTLEKTVVIEDPVVSSYLDTGLTQETTYDYEIYAIDYAGNQSTTATVTEATGPAPYLDHFEITVPTDVVGQNFTVTFKAISNYGFIMDSFNDTADITASEGTITPTQVTFVNGEAQVNFQYTNDTATGNVQLTLTITYTTVSNTSNPISVDVIAPDTPVFVEATPQSSTSVYLRWGQVTDTGGAPNYYIDIYRNGVKIITVSGTSTTYTDNNCQPNTQYTYYLKSRDSVGNVSAASSSITVTTPESEQDTTPPSIPTGLTVVSTGENFIAIKWDPSTDTGGSGLGGYKIYRGALEIATVDASTTTYTDLGLEPDTEYVYHLRAFDNAGNYSDFSDALIARTRAQVGDTTPPTIPQNLQAQTIDDTSIKLTWSASTDTGGSGLAGYRIYREDVNNYGTAIAFVDASTTEYTNTGLQPGTTYRYKIKAVDNAGNTSDFSAVAEATTTDSSVDTQNPTAPTNVQLTALSPSDARISWDASTDNVAVDYYEIYQVTPSTNPFQDYDYTLIGETPETTYVISGLSPGETYNFCVRAVDTSGNKSRYSEIKEVTMPNASDDHNPPTPPQNLRFVSVTSTSVIITYDPAIDNESGVKQYHIFKNGTEIAQTDALSYEDTDVQPNETYEYYVKAEDWNSNISEASNIISTIVPLEDNEPPSTPANLTYIATPDHVILTWGMSYDDISGVDHYEIQKVNTPFKSKGDAYATTIETTFTDENVVVGSKYIYYVFAVDRAGNKSVPASVTVVVPDSGQEDYTLYFPHIDVTDFWWTGFAVVNPGEQDADVTFKFYDNDGNEVASLDRTIPAKGKIVTTVRNLFNDNVPEGASWYKIETPVKLDGFELFGTNDWKELVGVKIFSDPATKLIYPEIMVDDNHWTGVALINVSSEAANVVFKAYDSNGNEIATSNTVNLPSNGKQVALVEDFFDSFPAETAYIVAESDKNIIGFELFGYKSHVGLAGLSAVPFDQNDSTTQTKTLTDTVKGDETKVLSAIVLNSTEVQLLWDALDPAPDLYRIYEVEEISTPFGNSLDKVQLWGETTDTQFIVSGLTPDTDYQFAVYPVYGDQEGSPTNVVSVHTMAGDTNALYTYVCPRIEENFGGETSIAMVNTGNASVEVTLQLLGENAEVLEEQKVSLNTLNKIREKLTNIFSAIPDTAKAVRIISEQPLIVWENFENNCDNGNNDGYFDTLYAFDRALSAVNFTHIAPETYMWDSYVCVWNLSENGNNTNFTAYSPDGTVLGVFPHDIMPGDVVSDEIHGFIPDDSLLQNIGWVQVTGTGPMNGYFAFSNKEHTLMGAIEGQ